jgi:hypothetical protein
VSYSPKQRTYALRNQIHRSFASLKDDSVRFVPRTYGKHNTRTGFKNTFDRQQKRPSGAEARIFGALGGTAKAVPFPFSGAGEFSRSL